MLPIRVKALAAKAGISPDMAGSAIAQLLPGIVDKLTPNGSVPDSQQTPGDGVHYPQEPWDESLLNFVWRAV